MINSSPSTSRRRRRERPLSRGGSFFQGFILLLVLPAPWISAGVLGGARVWLAFPLMFLTFLGGGLWLLSSAFQRGGCARRLTLPGMGFTLVWIAFAAVHAWKISIIPGASINELLQIFVYLVTYMTLGTMPLARRRWKELLGAYLMLVSFVAWYGLVQYSHESTSIWMWPRPEQYGNRVSATFICPNHFAHFAVMGGLVGLSVLLAPRLKPLLRLIGGYTFFVTLPGIFLSLSRSGWIALVVGVGVFSLLMAARVSWRRVLLVFFLGCVSFGGLLFTLFTFSESFHHRIAEAMRGDIRLRIWPDTLSLIDSAPWLGYGGGSYRYVIGFFRDSFNRPELYVRYAHNEYLHVLAEYGIVGLVLMVCLFAVVFFWSMRQWYKADGGFSKVLWAGWLSVLLATAAHSIFDFNLHIFSNAMALAYFGAIMVSANGERLRALSGRWLVWHRACYSVGVLVCVLAAFACLCIIQSQRHFFSSYAKETFLNPSLKEERLLRSAQWNPWDPEPARLLGHFYKTRFTLNRNPEQKMKFGEKATTWYAHAIRANAWDTEALYGKSWVLFRAGEADEALALMNEVTQKEPFSAFYYLQYGVMLRKTGSLEGAQQAFFRAGQLAPKHKGIRENLKAVKKLRR